MENIIKDIFNTLPIPFFIIGKNKKINFANESFANLIEKSEDEITKKNYKIIPIYDDSKQKKLDLFNCIDESKNNILKTTAFIKNDDFIPISITAQRKHSKYFSNDEIIVIISDITKIVSCYNNEDNDTKIKSFYNIVGKTTKMQELYKMIILASESLANVLITGESGTGKELIARAIHANSKRNDKPFVTVNCSSLPETLLEAELFGYVKGSFTGAYRDKIGKFEAANNGTIFLDEIGDLNLSTQVKLLRVIQEKSITRIGDNKERKIDMRIITATNKNLHSLVMNKEFREDLFYRLKVFQIVTIPLRERMNDIPLLIKYFIGKFNKTTGKTIKGLTNDALKLAMEYCWPGNVRELENSIEHAFVLVAGDFIDTFDLPQEIRITNLRQGICNGMIKINPNLKENSDKNFNSKQSNNNIKKRNTITPDELLRILKRNNWNKSETARQLGISRVALWKKIKKFGLEEP